jgi:hypothetical protein
VHPVWSWPLQCRTTHPNNHKHTEPPLSGGSLTHTHAHVLPEFRSMKYPDLVVCVEALGPALRGPQDEELLRFFTSPEAVAGAPELAPDPASGRPAVEALRIVRDPSTSLGRGYAFVLLRSKARLRLCTLLYLKWGNALGARRACLQFCSQFQSGNDLRTSYFLGTLDSHALTMCCVSQVCKLPFLDITPSLHLRLPSCITALQSPISECTLFPSSWKSSTGSRPRCAIS